MCFVAVPVTSKHVTVEPPYLTTDYMIGHNPIFLFRTLGRALSVILFISSHSFGHMVYGAWPDYLLIEDH
jgi:hypothetical protein